MQRAGPTRGWPGLNRRRTQAGQALIYGMFVLIGGLAALFFLFNTGQLTREKTKLVNTADAVAYSAGIMHARALNFDAYMNRAMMANTVAIAQLVALSSWIKYVDNVNSYGFVLAQPKWNAYYTTYQSVIPSAARYLMPAFEDHDTLKNLASASDTIIRNVLMNAQTVVYGGLGLARSAVMKEVTDANYLADGDAKAVEVETDIFAFNNFLKSYSGDERTRFAEVSRVASKKDSFVKGRPWVWAATPGMGACLPPYIDLLIRNGGTELVGFDEWKAIDALSAIQWEPTKVPLVCAPTETPAGAGGRSAAKDGSSSFSFDPGNYNFTMGTNPIAGGIAMALASSDAWDYSGLPSFYDLSKDALDKGDDARLKFAVRLHRNIKQTVTSEGRSGIVNTPRLNAYKAKPAGKDDELVAVSVVEAFFERPKGALDNEYGVSIGKPHEMGSLFNPFWQVHLIQSDSAIRIAQARQGVVLP